MIEQYPDSEYASSAILKFDLAFDHLAAKEMEIGRYYLKRGNYAAAINRFRVVVEQYQTTTHTPEALHRLVECYLSLGLTDEAQTAGAILGHNFQSTPVVSGQLRPADPAGAEARGQGRQLAGDDLPAGDPRRVALIRGRAGDERCCAHLDIRDMVLIDRVELTLSARAERADRRDRGRQVDPARRAGLRAGLARPGRDGARRAPSRAR